MHAFPGKKGTAGDVFLLAFTDGSFGMYNKQVVAAAAAATSFDIDDVGAGSGGMAVERCAQGRGGIRAVVT
jgi:hypothetical protein